MIINQIEEIQINISHHIVLCSEKYSKYLVVKDNISCLDGQEFSTLDKIEYANRTIEEFNKSTPPMILDIQKFLSLFLLSDTDVTIDNLEEYVKSLLQPLESFITDSRLVDCSVEVVSCVSVTSAKDCSDVGIEELVQPLELFISDNCCSVISTKDES